MTIQSLIEELHEWRDLTGLSIYELIRLKWAADGLALRIMEERERRLIKSELSPRN